MNPLKKQLIIGTVIGLSSAFLLSFILFLFTKDRYGIEDYFYIYYSPAMMVPILSISLLGNFVLFFLFLKLNKDMVSKGILTATFVVGIFIFIMKFFFT